MKTQETLMRAMYPKLVVATATTVLGIGYFINPNPTEAATIRQLGEVQEAWSFDFNNYPIEHQGQNVLNINVSYDYKQGIGVNDPTEYPEFTQVYNYIDNYLTNYPNETDFWEIVNKNLTQALLSEPIPTTFGINYNLAEVVDNLRVKIDVQPSESIPYPRSSIVTRTPGLDGTLNEAWSFDFNNYPIEHQGQNVLDINVGYNYRQGIGVDDPTEYPEFTQVYNYIDNYLTNYPNETDFWEIVNKNLTEALLTEPIPTTFGINYDLAEVVDDLTVKIDVQPSESIPIPRSSIVTRTPEPDGTLNEAWSFDFENYPIEHQGENVLDINVGYNYKEGIGVDDPTEYPEFTQVYNYIDNYLTDYPNETDFWEIVNKNLTEALLTEPIPTTFGINYDLDEVVDDLRVKIGVQPSQSIPIPRSSIVTRTPGLEGTLSEAWNFDFLNYPIEHQGENVLDIFVSYDYRDGIGVNDPTEYPEFTQVYNFIDNYLTNYPNETDFWEIVNKNLTEALLTEPIPTTFGINYNLAEVVDNLTVKINVQQSESIPIARSSTVRRTVIASVPEPGVIWGFAAIVLMGLVKKKLPL
jgi:hypothetical protein